VLGLACDYLISFPTAAMPTGPGIWMGTMFLERQHRGFIGAAVADPAMEYLSSRSLPAWVSVVLASYTGGGPPK
jgi:hypothetical protein